MRAGLKARALVLRSRGGAIQRRRGVVADPEAALDQMTRTSLDACAHFRMNIPASSVVYA